MPEDKITSHIKSRESLRWKIFIIYLGVSLGLLFGLNGILIINNNQLFGNLSFFIGIIIFGAIYLFLAIIFWLIIKKILSPLNDLVKGIQVFMEGNWEQRIYIQNNDEAGILAEQFNDILDEMVNLYVAQETISPGAVTAVENESPSSPVLAKMDNAQDIDELFMVAITGINQVLQSNKSKLVLIADEAGPQIPDFAEIVKGNGHGSKPQHQE